MAQKKIINVMREFLGIDEPNEQPRVQGLPRVPKTAGPRRGEIIPKEREARRMRLNPTKAEEVLNESLASRAGTATPFKAQALLYGYIADQYCEAAKLVVEVDGGYHKATERAQADIERDEALTRKGILTLRFKNEEVLQNPKKVLEQIHEIVRQRYNALHRESSFHRQLVRKANDEIAAIPNREDTITI
jgi:very-short-patch-repair endonuclease